MNNKIEIVLNDDTLEKIFRCLKRSLIINNKQKENTSLFRLTLESEVEKTQKKIKEEA